MTILSLYDEHEVRLGEDKLLKVKAFKYLGAINDAKKEVQQKYRNRVSMAWNKRREVTTVICDKKVPMKLKHKIYKA